MFGDLDWPLNASRGFVSISRASCRSILSNYDRVRSWIFFALVLRPLNIAMDRRYRFLVSQVANNFKISRIRFYNDATFTFQNHAIIRRRYASLRLRLHYVVTHCRCQIRCSRFAELTERSIRCSARPSFAHVTSLWRRLHGWGRRGSKRTSAHRPSEAAQRTGSAGAWPVLTELHVYDNSLRVSSLNLSMSVGRPRRKKMLRAAFRVQESARKPAAWWLLVRGIIRMTFHDRT